MSDADVQTLLRQNLGGNTPAWGAPDVSTIYQLMVPASTTLTDGPAGNTCCVGFYGYHADVLVDGTDVPYEVICECTNTGTDHTQLQRVTTTQAHELVETVTDAYEGTPGWLEPADDFYVFTLETGGEVADLCSFVHGNRWVPPDMTYSIQRTWSNAAAAAGHDPCVGNAATAYYQTIPTETDTVTVGTHGAPGIAIALGATKTISFKVYADAPSGPFNVVMDNGSHYYGTGAQTLEVSGLAGPYAAGETFTAQVKVVAENPKGPYEVLVVATTPVDTTQGPTTTYYALVGQN